MKAANAPKHASEREGKARPASFVSCPTCGARFLKTRTWTTFCSTKCRKASWEEKRLAGKGISLGEMFKEIGTRLTAIEARLGIKEDR